MAETPDSVEETHRQTRGYVSGYSYGFSCFRRSLYKGSGTLFFYMFPIVFRFTNHVFPQSLTCVYVAEMRNSLPETCSFVPSSGGNVKIQSSNLTGFSVFPALSVAVSA